MNKCSTSKTLSLTFSFLSKGQVCNKQHTILYKQAWQFSQSMYSSVYRRNPSFTENRVKKNPNDVLNLLLFWRSCCHWRRGCLKSLKYNLLVRLPLSLDLDGVLVDSSVAVVTAQKIISIFESGVIPWFVVRLFDSTGKTSTSKKNVVTSIFRRVHWP